MGYYIDQLAEQDRQKRLADLMTAGEAGSFPAFMPQPDYSGERGAGNYAPPMQGPQQTLPDYGGGERTLGNYPAPQQPDYRDARDLGAMSTGGGLPYQPQTKLSDLSPTEMARAEQINAQLNDPAYWGQTGTEVLPQQEQQQQPPLSYIRKGPANSFTEKDDFQWLADATAAGAFQGKNLPAGYIPRQAGDYQSAGAGTSGGGQSSELARMQKEAIDNLMKPVIGGYGRIDEVATMANRQKAFAILQSMEKDRLSSAETRLKNDKLTAEITNLRGVPERDKLVAEKTRAEIAQLNAKPTTPEQAQDMERRKAMGKQQGEMAGFNTQAQQGATGENSIAGLSPAIQDQVKALAEGRMAFPSGFALKSPYWQQMLQAVSQYDPNFDAINYNARAATRKDFTSGKSAENIKSLNTAIGHLDTITEKFNALENSNFPSYNTSANWMGSKLGNEKIQSAVGGFDTAKLAVSGEMAKVFRSVGMSQQEIEHWMARLSSSQSPADFKSTIKTATDLMGGRLDAIGDQYTKGMGKSTQGLDLLSPDAKKQFQKIQGGEKPKLTSTDGEAMKWLMQNQNHPRAAEVKAKLGIQ